MRWQATQRSWLSRSSFAVLAAVVVLAYECVLRFQSLLRTVWSGLFPPNLRKRHPRFLLRKPELEMRGKFREGLFLVQSFQRHSSFHRL